MPLTMMRLEQLWKRRYFLRLFGVMFFIGLLGILITGTISFFLATRAVDREVVNTHNAILEQVRSTLDQQYSEIYNIFAMLSSDSNLNKAIYFDDTVQPEKLFVYRDLSKSPNAVEVSHPSIRVIWLHFSRSDSIIVNSAKYPYDFFYDFRLTKAEQTLLTKTIGKEFSFRILVNTESWMESQSLLYSASLPMRANQPYCTAYISLKPEVVSGLLRPITDINDALVLLTGDDGQPLLLRQRGMDETETEAVLAHIASAMDSEGWITIGGNRYFIMRAHSAVSNTRIYAVLPSRRMQGAAVGIAQTTGLTFLLTACVLMVVVYIGARRQYKPIRTLMESVSRVAEQPDGTRTDYPFQDEIRFISSMLNMTFADNENLRRLIGQAHSQIEDQLLRSLLDGRPPEGEAMKEIGFTGGVYQVLVFEGEPSPTAPDLSFIGSFEGLRWRGVMVGDDLIVLTEMDGGHEHPDVIYELVDAVRDAYADENRRATVGIGGAVRDISDIQVSYAQARTAVQYAHVRGRFAVIHIDEAPQGEAAVLSYPAAEELRISNLLKSGDGDAAWDAIKNLIVHNTQNLASMPAVISTLYCSVMNTFYRTAAESNLLYAPTQKPVPDTPQALEALLPELESQCHAIAENVRQKRQNVNEQLYRHVIDFITKHYAEELSLDVLSEHTGYSASYISHVFKQVSGDNYIDFLNRFRIEKAKELLTASDLPINDIAVRVGFISHANFSRTFKRFEGVAPGQYRLYNK